MPSFWPFKSDNTSAASFEKALSQLSSKISKASAQNDRLRQNKRHRKALLTLYSGFTYIIVALILTLVTGWENWSALEYSAVAGGPVLIYGTRTALDAYYNYRVANAQDHLNSLYAQREKTIEKLKAATKYNSTQQLLDKYGGTPQKRQPSPQSKKRKGDISQDKQGTPQGRTGFAPPPTANIPGKPNPPAPVTTGPGSNQVPGQSPGPHGSGAPPLQGSVVMPSEEFAPNAFPAGARQPLAHQPASQYAASGPQWYDRIMDVILGEDETSAKNRVALICQNCRLVNGQAPPGARTMEDIGRWRCSSCHSWNGVESETKKMLNRLADGGTTSPTSPDMLTSAASERDTVTGEVEGENSDYEHVDEHVGEDSDGKALVDSGSADR